MRHTHVFREKVNVNSQGSKSNPTLSKICIWFHIMYCSYFKSLCNKHGSAILTDDFCGFLKSSQQMLSLVPKMATTSSHSSQANSQFNFKGGQHNCVETNSCIPLDCRI